MTNRLSVIAASCMLVLALSHCFAGDVENRARSEAVFNALNRDAFDAAETAFDAGPDLDFQFEEFGDRWTMLQIFASASAVPPVRWLLEHGADPNVASPKDHRTALHIAVERGSVEVVGLLLRYEADATLRSNKGTALELAHGLEDGENKMELLKLLQ